MQRGPPPGLGTTAFTIRRLEKERTSLASDASLGDTIRLVESPDNLTWILEIHGASGTFYANEKFRLRFRFDSTYPLDPPEVVFIGKPPVHPHVYSNGHICLSILYTGWSPALSTKSVCLSLISMLSSAKHKKPPPDDREYVALCGTSVSPKRMRWDFHDDKA